jgi:hypothetical protein
MAAKKSRWWKEMWERWALPVAFVGGLLGAVHVAILIWQIATASPEVTASPTTPLRVSYDRKRTVVTFAFEALLHNEGAKAEILRDVAAEFTAGKGDRVAKYHFNVTQIRLKDGDAPVPLNLPIAKETHRVFTCEISTYMTDQLKAVLQHEQSARTLEVTFKGRKTSYPITFAFDMSKDLSADLLRGNTSPYHFIGSNWK